MFREFRSQFRAQPAPSVDPFGYAGVGVDDVRFMVDPPTPRRPEGDCGNPCLGIAIACILSVPLWVGMASLAFLLH